MKHFASEQWADYVRGVAPKGEQEGMTRHLNSGCKSCGKVVGMWRGVLDVAQRERQYTPPEDVVRLVKGGFAVASARGGLSRPANWAKLIFDSFHQPLPAGVRSLEVSARHMVFRAGSILVDVRVDPAHQAASVSLAGQVLDQSKPECSMKDVPVAIRSGRKDIASTTTNQFGEFHLELDREVEKALHLVVGVEEKKPIIITLRPLEAGRKPTN